MSDLRRLHRTARCVVHAMKRFGILPGESLLIPRRSDGHSAAAGAAHNGGSEGGGREAACPHRPAYSLGASVVVARAEQDAQLKEIARFGFGVAVDATAFVP